MAQCYLLGGLACCAAGSREPRVAARLFGAMENLRSEAGVSINAGLAEALAHATTSVTLALGPSRFGSEFRAGQQLSRDAASRLALREGRLRLSPRRIIDAPDFSDGARPTSPGWSPTV